MQISMKRLEATLSGILSDRYQRKISVRGDRSGKWNVDRNDCPACRCVGSNPLQDGKQTEKKAAGNPEKEQPALAECV